MKASYTNTRVEGVASGSELPVLEGPRTYATTPDLILTKTGTPDTMATSHKQLQSPTGSLAEVFKQNQRRKDNIPQE